MEHSALEKPRILVFCDYYLPGYRAGGPIRSVSNIVAALSDDFSFHVITRDRDIKSRNRYPGISRSSWISMGNARVRYFAPWQAHFVNFLRCVAEVKPDLIYLNSFFSPLFTIQPLILKKFGMLPRAKILIAPRGEFAKAALEISWYKKRPYLEWARRASLYDGATWHVSSEYEERDVLNWLDAAGHGEAMRQIGREKVVVAMSIAPDISLEIAGAKGATSAGPTKTSGSTSFSFLSRISRMKNLVGALKAIRSLRGAVKFDIYGPIEDRGYWNECRGLIRDMPSHIHVRYMGEVEPDRVLQTIAAYHFFFLPTLGENFGHVIREALSACRPVIVSDRTPWRHLEELGIGWDVPLGDPEMLGTILQECVNMDEAEYTRLVNNVIEHNARRAQKERGVVDINRAMFSIVIR